MQWRTPRNFRDPAYLMPRIADKLLVAFIMLTLFWAVGNNWAPTNLLNQVALLFMVGECVQERREGGRGPFGGADS
jgi:ATP-binding cassette subfamily G (WHITE) protein 2